MAGPTPLTAGDGLYGQGFVQVRFMDTSQGHPGVLRTRFFIPANQSPYTRYGTDLSQIEYLPNQYTGAHSTASAGRPGNFEATRLLVPVLNALGIPAVPSLWDLTDLDLVCRADGYSATWWVLDKAMELGLIERPKPIEPVPPTPTPTPIPPLPVVDPPAPVQPPTQPPIAGSGGLSSPEQRIDELWAWIGQQWPLVKPIAVQMLKMFRKAVGR